MARNANSPFFGSYCILTFCDIKCRILAFRDSIKHCYWSLKQCYTARGQEPCEPISLLHALWAESKRPRALWANLSLSRIALFDISILIVDILTLLKNIDIDKAFLEILENIDINIDINKDILENININKISISISISTRTFWKISISTSPF